MKFAVVVFPGTWSDWDCVYALQDLGQTAERVWHQESALDDYDGVILPGGFSYGDHLRCGAIAKFSPVMSAVERFAMTGRPILGICNGFQILCEAGLLPGALLRNASLQFRCQPQKLTVERLDTGFTNLCQPRQIVQVPISHGEGQYFAPESVLDELEEDDRVLFRYTDGNPNGSLRDIAGIMNSMGNVLGMMPHPERASDELLGGTDGNCIWRSIIQEWGSDG
ncbi:MAG: phosphoribosylformylglycinamidine synthase subunit PurQ [Candidatus Spechtbacteria bacterium SB0662_bin_43]|uniref:Phosphoribosylformylglycinamidine synthase subunit PurQ n=1 Tax=Candidatus Spechtbacteria bacterium SB0662_bin_43 TaxID=2604897 RepID=A0A845D9P6_9BACT|nr:phosphoribosylformylglycinamidine synthase subunit PurQ [Candidatus Spechtbacteria bacterium SB0662_bin_43]